MPTTDRLRHDERLTLPWSWWAGAAVLALLLAAAVHGGAGPLRAAVGWGVLLPVALLLVLRMHRTRVTVDDRALRAGPATLPLEAVAAVEPLVGAPTTVPGRQEWRLPRPWVRGAVRVLLVEGASPDGHRSWVVPTRHPDALAAALTGA